MMTRVMANDLNRPIYFVLWVAANILGAGAFEWALLVHLEWLMFGNLVGTILLYTLLAALRFTNIGSNPLWCLLSLVPFVKFVLPFYLFFAPPHLAHMPVSIPVDAPPGTYGIMTDLSGVSSWELRDDKLSAASVDIV